MTPREQAAFNAGIETARQMALTAAVSLEVRDDAPQLRQQAAVAALQGFAAGLKIAFQEPPSDQTLMHRAFAAISAQEGDSGTLECPTCKGRLSWVRDSYDGHLHVQCETDGCLRWMQ